MAARAAALAATLACMAVVSHAATREYFIAAEVSEWDYTPSGINQCTGQAWDEDAAVWTVDGVGSTYKKPLYIGYTDNTFEERIERPEEEEHLGFLGPLMRAEVGDTLRVVFLNRLDMPANLVLPGLDVVGTSEHDALMPMPAMESMMYEFTVPASAGPAEGALSSRLHLYFATDSALQYAGLAGPLLVTAAGKADAEGRPMDVDREFVTLFHVSNENSSPLAALNLADAGIVCPEPQEGEEAACYQGLPDGTPDAEAAIVAASSNSGVAVMAAADVEEGNMMHGINGYMFCNMPGLNATIGDRC